jgi:hypothetical protein
LFFFCDYIFFLFVIIRIIMQNDFYYFHWIISYFLYLSFRKVIRFPSFLQFFANAIIVELQFIFLKVIVQVAQIMFACLIKLLISLGILYRVHYLWKLCNCLFANCILVDQWLREIDKLHCLFFNLPVQLINFSFILLYQFHFLHYAYRLCYKSRHLFKRTLQKPFNQKWNVLKWKKLIRMVSVIVFANSAKRYIR